MTTAPATLRVAYLTSRFPKLSETFISTEIAEVIEQGVDVDIYALVREDAAVVHPEVVALLPRTTYPHFFGVLADQIRWVRRAPRAYARAWIRGIWGNIRSPRFLLRALVVVPVAASFARSMSRRGTDHIHAHWATHSGLAAYVVHLLTDIPYSITAHAHDIHVDRTMLEEKLIAAAAVATISDFNRKHLIDLYGDDFGDKVEVIRAGVDLDDFAPPPRRLSDELRIVVVASLEVRKGHEVLLQACRMVLDQGIPAACTIVGDGPNRSAITSLIAELGLGDRATLLGAQSRPGVVRALSDADVFVLPSITLESGKMEGIPVALMEAMAMGLPVVATRMSGVPELVRDGENGRLITEGDVGGLADVLAELHESPELRRRMGEAGRRLVTDEYNLAENARRLIGMFASSVPNSAGAGGR